MNSRYLMIAGAISLFVSLQKQAHAQDIQLDHCSCTSGGTPSDSTFTFRGRMTAWNGNPVYRIWRVGTQRMLGIRGVCLSALNLGKLTPSFGSELWADFTVSAVTPQRSGVMQFICIRKVQNAFFRKEPARDDLPK